MLFSSWLRTLRSPWARTGRQTRPQTPRRRGPRLTVEQLEDRLVPSNFSAATVSDLIADINAANKAGGANTIVLTAPTNSPYILAAVDNTTDGATGLPVIAVSDNLTILGNGDTIARSTAAGTPAFRLLDVAGGASLNLANLTLQGGLAFGSGVSADGGGIYNQGTLDLNGVTVQSNIAQGQNGAPGRSFAGHPGASAAGGGIWSNAALTLENGTTVQNNKALGGIGGVGGLRPGLNFQIIRLPGGKGGDAYGGGLYVNGGTATLTDVTLSSNAALGGQGGLGASWPAARGGGVVYAAGGIGGNGLGGGLATGGGTTILLNDTVSQNTAMGGNRGGGSWNSSSGGNGSGGGLYAGGGAITLHGDRVTGNAALGSNGPGAGAGGGLYIDPAATVYLDAFTLANVLNNTASTSDPNIHGSYSLLP
jgi:hypothetical protein